MTARDLKKWADDVTVVRCSSLTGYPDCERRGAARLFWREIKAMGFTLTRLGRGIGSVVGVAVHKGASVENDENAKSGKLPPVTVALDAARDELVENLKSGEVTFDGPHGSTHSARDAGAQVVMMTSAYHHLVAPRLEPIIVEERLEAQVSPDIILSGQPDLVAREPNAVHDLKTGGRLPRSFTAQLGGYSLLARSAGLPIDHASIEFLQRVNPAKPQPPPVTKAAQIAQAETAATHLIYRIAADLKTFREGDAERRIRPGDPWAFTANPASVLCSPKYCPAYNTEFCHEGAAAHGVAP